MNDVDKLNQIRAIKTLRKRKAQVACLRAKAKAAQIETRAKALQERHEAKQTAANSYAENRFLQLREANNLDMFFTSMTIGLLRHRKEVASLGLRTKRAVHEHSAAMKEQRFMAEALARATNAERLMSDAYNIAQDKTVTAAELDAEEDLIELVNLGSQHRDHQ